MGNVKTYIRMQVIKAEVCTWGIYSTIQGVPLGDRDINHKGYIVYLEKGQTEWVDKETFENTAWETCNSKKDDD